MVAIVPSQPLQERPLLLSSKRVASLASRAPPHDIRCPLAHVTCEYWIHARPPVLTSHRAPPRLAKSHGCSDSVSPCLNVPTPHSPPALAVLVAGDLGGEIRRLPSALFTTSTGTGVSSSSA